MEQSIAVDPDLVDEGVGRRRRCRTVEEKRRIVEEALSPGASVARAALLHVVTANQAFQWRRQYQSGDLNVPENDVAKLLPVIVTDPAEETPKEASAESHCGSINIEFPGRALVTIEAGVDRVLAAAVVERLMR